MQPVALALVDLNRLREKLAAVEAVSPDDAEPSELRQRLQAAQHRIKSSEIEVLETEAPKEAKPAKLVPPAEVIRCVEVIKRVEVSVLAVGEAAMLRLAKADRLILQALAHLHPGSLTK